MLLRQRVQLGLIHVAVAMTLVPINSTLNRVMIKELAFSATLVAALASLPYLFSPLQVAIGSFSDRHPLGGYRRTPYILLGLLLCAAGVVAAPQAAFLMVERTWQGLGLATLAFGAWGMGYNFATVSYLSLATELSGEKGRGRTVAVMWFMMIVGIILTAIALSAMLEPYSPQLLERAFLVIGAAALSLGLVGLVGLEPRGKEGLAPATDDRSWVVLGREIFGNPQVTYFFIYMVVLLSALLGQDLLLEPFGGQAFGMSVRETTRITSLWGGCVLLAFIAAGILEGRTPKKTIARIGGWSALVGFLLIAASGMLENIDVFYGGVLLLGFGTGLATISNLGIMLDMTVVGSVGLFIGAWGMASAISRLIGSLVGGVLRDAITSLAGNLLAGYMVVFVIEAVMMLVTLVMLGGIDVVAFKDSVRGASLAERAAMAGDV